MHAHHANQNHVQQVTGRPRPVVLRRSHPTPLHFRETQTGADLVSVPLSSGRQAIVCAEGYDHLRKLGVTPFWQENDDGHGRRYVRCYMPGLPKSGLVMVARLILGVPAGTVVHYRDKDRLNLRRFNLTTADGWAKGREVAAIAEANAGEEF